MRFYYAVVAAITAVSVNALYVYNIIAPVPGITDLDREGGFPWLSTTAVPDYCKKDVPLSPPPTAANIKQCMVTADKVANKAFFWSRVDEEKRYRLEAEAWRKAYQPDLLMLEDLWLDASVKTWAETQGKRFGDKAQTDFWSPASQAMAELANGQVLVLLPATADPVHKPALPRHIIWYDIEYPALQKNKNVKALFKVSPGSPNKSAVPLSFSLGYKCYGHYEGYEGYEDYEGYGVF